MRTYEMGLITAQRPNAEDILLTLASGTQVHLPIRPGSKSADLKQHLDAYLGKRVSDEAHPAVLALVQEEERVDQAAVDAIQDTKLLIAGFLKKKSNASYRPEDVVEALEYVLGKFTSLEQLKRYTNEQEA
jgi:hypothetical protein